MNELISILKESKASDFIIRQTNTVSQEAFFIGQKLDMGRAKDVTHTMVTVYVDSEDKNEEDIVPNKENKSLVPVRNFK